MNASLRLIQEAVCLHHLSLYIQNPLHSMLFFKIIYVRDKRFLNIKSDSIWILKQQTVVADPEAAWVLVTDQQPNSEVETFDLKQKNSDRIHRESLGLSLHHWSTPSHNIFLLWWEHRHRAQVAVWLFDEHGN